jgi:homoserine kinase
MRSNRQSVTVRVPASTSNCGAGFDTLGLALGLYNRVTLAPAPGASPRPARAGDGRAAEMVAAAASAFFDAAGKPPEGFRYRIQGDVPAARGLGSSVTVVAGVLAGLNVLHGTGLSRQKLVELATAVEGHPDNASAGILGGFCVSRCDPSTGAYRATVRFRVPAALAFVVVSPELELLTKESRGALPAALPYFDAVRSINSVAYFVAAFATGDYARLRDATGDFMHEPYRLPRIPGAAAAIAAGIAAGAHTGWLSGSGSSVLCLAARSHAAATGRAMKKAFREAGVGSTIRVLAADNGGLVVE